jgi:hypothetical protein
MARFSQPGTDGVPGPTGPAGASSSTLLLETEAKTANYTAVLTDRDKIIAMNGTTLSLFIPLQSSVNFPIGTMIYAYNLGAATFTVIGVAGVVVRNGGTVPQYQTVSIRKRAANEWVMQL